MRSPFCLPRMTCATSSSPRLTRCNTVWRETPSLRVASCMVTKPSPRSLAESGDEVIGQANAPGCAGRQLLARNDAVVEPAVQSRRGDAEHDRGLADGQ